MPYTRFVPALSAPFAPLYFSPLSYMRHPACRCPSPVSRGSWAWWVGQGGAYRYTGQHETCTANLYGNPVTVERERAQPLHAPPTSGGAVEHGCNPQATSGCPANLGHNRTLLRTSRNNCCWVARAMTATHGLLLPCHAPQDRYPPEKGFFAHKNIHQAWVSQALKKPICGQTKLSVAEVITCTRTQGRSSPPSVQTTTCLVFGAVPKQRVSSHVCPKQAQYTRPLVKNAVHLPPMCPLLWPVALRSSNTAHHSQSLPV